MTVSYSGFVNGDTAASLTTPPTVSTTATAASAAGTYPITASGAVSANYTISYVSGTLTVTRAALTVTANNQTKAYGAANPTLTVSYSGFVNGDTAASLTTPPTVSTATTATSAVGTYPITASGAVSANYTISYVSRHADGDARGADGDGGQPDEGVRRGEPDVDGELQRVRQRRHGGEPHDPAHGVDDGATHRARSGRIRSRPAVR